MKKTTALLVLLAPLAVWAQNKAVKKKISLNLTEEFHVLDNDKNIRQGLYMVTAADGSAVVRGKYDNNKKIGVWYYYDPNNKLVQQYDYTSEKLVYINPDSESYVKTEYRLPIGDIEKAQPPIKIGGSTLAFLSFYNSKDIPPSIIKEKSDISVTYTIDVTEQGQIDKVFAEYEANGTAEKRKLPIKANSYGLLDFIPAKIDGKGIKSVVMLSTTIGLDKIRIYGNYENLSTQKN